VVGATSFPFVGEPEVSFDRSYKLARDNGPNLAVAQATIDQFKLAALKAKRSMLPTLNLNGGLGYSSYASTAGQSAITGNWSGYNWTAGLTLSVPWGLTAGRAAYRQAVAGVRSEQVAYDQTDQGLVVGVRAAVRGVQTSIASVRSSAENTKFAQKAYELTKAQFDAGLATSYLVLQAQNTLETARVSELQAKVNLLSAIANLRFLRGQFAAALPNQPSRMREPAAEAGFSLLELAVVVLIIGILAAAPCQRSRRTRSTRARARS
jgi:outer membrane protein